MADAEDVRFAGASVCALSASVCGYLMTLVTADDCLQRLGPKKKLLTFFSTWLHPPPRSHPKSNRRVMVGFGGV